MDKPRLKEKCTDCDHEFGVHAQSYDGKLSGCIQPVANQRMELTDRCYCEGFAIRYRYQPTPDTAAADEINLGASSWGAR